MPGHRQPGSINKCPSAALQRTHEEAQEDKVIDQALEVEPEWEDARVQAAGVATATSGCASSSAVRAMAACRSCSRRWRPQDTGKL